MDCRRVRYLVENVQLRAYSRPQVSIHMLGAVDAQNGWPLAALGLLHDRDKTSQEQPASSFILRSI